MEISRLSHFFYCFDMVIKTYICTLHFPLKKDICTKYKQQVVMRGIRDFYCLFDLWRKDHIWWLLLFITTIVQRMKKRTTKECTSRSSHLTLNIHTRIFQWYQTDIVIKCRLMIRYRTDFEHELQKKKRSRLRGAPKRKSICTHVNRSRTPISFKSVP